MNAYELRGTQNERTGESHLWITKDGEPMDMEEVASDLREMQAEIERLRAELNEARFAARHCCDALNHTGDGRLYMQALALWPWINQVYVEKSADE
jgi:uncharacterized small protein (DUF1192 family)